MGYCSMILWITINDIEIWEKAKFEPLGRAKMTQKVISWQTGGWSWLVSMSKAVEGQREGQPKGSAKGSETGLAVFRISFKESAIMKILNGSFKFPSKSRFMSANSPWNNAILKPWAYIQLLLEPKHFSLFFLLFSPRDAFHVQYHRPLSSGARLPRGCCELGCLPHPSLPLHPSSLLDFCEKNADKGKWSDLQCLPTHRN